MKNATPGPIFPPKLPPSLHLLKAGCSGMKLIFLNNMLIVQLLTISVLRVSYLLLFITSTFIGTYKLLLPPLQSPRLIIVRKILSIC